MRPSVGCAPELTFVNRLLQEREASNLRIFIRVECGQESNVFQAIIDAFVKSTRFLLYGGSFAFSASRFSI